MFNIEENEKTYAEFLYYNGYIREPKKCSCGGTAFSIQYDNTSKTSNCIFRCKNNKCRSRHSIRSNSFYSLFPKIKLRLISEIIKSFLNELNPKECYYKLKNDYNQSISLISVQEIYTEIRKVFLKYYITFNINQKY